MLFWLVDKIKEANRNEAYRRQYEDMERRVEESLPKMNLLCKNELERFSRNPSINRLYELIFREGLPVEKFRVSKEHIDVFYYDGSTSQIKFRTLGLADLSFNTTIFDNNPSLIPNWERKDGYVTRSINKYPYLYFCRMLRRFNESEECVVPHFDECLAVGYLLAEKTGLPYRKPDSTSMYVYGYFEFTTSPLKSW